VKKVKFLTSIAGLADPDRAKLDKKYEAFTQRAREASKKKGKEFKPLPVEMAIAELKQLDRYDDLCRGFKADFAFKTGDESLIPADVAAKWEAGGICVILADEKRVA
jgi:hypothetical protein